MAAVELFRELWTHGTSPDVFHFLDAHQDLTPEDQADIILTDQFHRARLGRTLDVEKYLERCPAVARDDGAVAELRTHERELRAEAAVRSAAYGPRHALDGASHKLLMLAPPRSARDDDEAFSFSGSLKEQRRLRELFVQPVGRSLASQPTANSDEPPRRLGRYQFLRTLGSGAFGDVWLARDPDIRREVAIKIPRLERFAPTEVDGILAEARSAGRLRHPGIVAMHDVGRSDSGPYIVMEYVEGRSLAEWIASGEVNCGLAAKFAERVAEALAHAHENGIFHRDLKPANVLVDRDGLPRVCDFGMALHVDDQREHRGEVAGSAYYMAPEQTRGESHRLDGRTDVWALGVILYEMLTGRRPFRGENRAELFDEIQHRDPVPPRQIAPDVPAELSRICLKCLARRMTDRYDSAVDLASDLRQWRAPAEQPPVRVASLHDPRHGSGPPPLEVAPQGLRAFTESESVAFLELLPGPRDRQGLPESIRFWKLRIEKTDADETFPVGLIYGPSGCGKSSLMRAGLLPRLAPHVVSIRLDATPDATERHLLRSLRKRFPALDQSLSLNDTLRALRSGQGLEPGQKCLIVLDQFEQWLHAQPDVTTSELADALRQCDGGRVQTILMIRDDFWMAATRLMQTLEVRVVEGANSAAVDLFDPQHAKKVLQSFGRALRRLTGEPDNRSEAAFLDDAVAALATDGKIVCVRLALFAEMLKSRPWTSATLASLGGIDGVGATYLEEIFDASTAPPAHKRHAPAARRVLGALLPEEGAEIKGHRRTDEELRAAAGYGRQNSAFEELLGILDHGLRLITPSDPSLAETVVALDGGASDGAAPASHGSSVSSKRSYQLAHDYLVPSLRDWLSRRRRETRRGRAELRLAERAAHWNARPEPRRLPAWWEHLWISALTRRSERTSPQRRMLRASARHHAWHGLLVMAILAAAGLVGFKLSADAFVAEVVPSATISDPSAPSSAVRLPDSPFVSWKRAALRREFEAAREPELKINFAIALMRVDDECRGFVDDFLMNQAEPEQLGLLFDALVAAGVDRNLLLEEARVSLDDSGAQTPKRARRRLRAACLLALHAPSDSTLSRNAGFVAGALARSDHAEFDLRLETLTPAAKTLETRLARIVRNPAFDMSIAVPDDWTWSDLPENPLWSEQQRDFAARALTRYVDGGDTLIDLVLDADESCFRILFQELAARAKTDATLIATLSDKTSKALLPTANVPSSKRDAAADRSRWNKFRREEECRARRAANGVIAQWKLNEKAGFGMALSAANDPRTRAWLVQRFARLDVEPRRLLDELLEPSTTVVARRMLSLALAEYEFASCDASVRSLLKGTLDHLLDDPDPGVHAAAERLLRRGESKRWWGGTTKEGKTAERLVEDAASPPRDPSRSEDRSWRIDGLGSTFVRIDRPERDRFHGRSTWFDARETVLRDFREYVKEPGDSDLAPVGYNPDASEVRWPKEDNCPAAFVSFPNACRYCNWLSQKCGIPREQWCYEADGSGGMRPVTGWLDKSGFRLPTVDEWQHAARAGAPAFLGRHFGDSDELLVDYAQHSRNTREDGFRESARLLPNDFGLFDMLGNVFEWTHSPKDESHDERDEPGKRSLLGGAFCIPARVVTSDKEERFWPTQNDYRCGFRVVRTEPAKP